MRLFNLDAIIDKQKKSENWKHSPYLNGVLTGLLIARAVVSGEELDTKCLRSGKTE